MSREPMTVPEAAAAYLEIVLNEQHYRENLDMDAVAYDEMKTRAYAVLADALSVLGWYICMDFEDGHYNVFSIADRVASAGNIEVRK